MYTNIKRKRNTKKAGLIPCSNTIYQKKNHMKQNRKEKEKEKRKLSDLRQHPEELYPLCLK